MSPELGGWKRGEFGWNSAESRRIIAEWTDTPTPRRPTQSSRVSGTLRRIEGNILRWGFEGYAPLHR
jgi:hypothetical protein